MSALRIAVLGAGLIGAKHARYVDACGDTVLAAICDPAPAAADLAARHGATCFTTLDDMLRDTRLDGVIIATPTALHEAHATACARHGLPMVVEKPIAHDVASAQRLVAAAKAAGVPLLVGHHRRYNPLVVEARRLLREGALGHLVNVVGQWSVLKPEAYFEPEWRRTDGGGPVLINLIHEIDTLRFVCGEITRVHAETSAEVRGFEVEDSASVLLRFANGALAAIAASDATPSPWTWEQGTGENPDFPESGCNSYRFMGTDAALEFPRLRLWRQDAGRGWNHALFEQLAEVPQCDVYAAQTAHFARVIRGTEAPVMTGADATRTLAATVAILDAARAGQPVTLAP